MDFVRLSILRMSTPLTHYGCSAGFQSYRKAQDWPCVTDCSCNVADSLLEAESCYGEVQTQMSPILLPVDKTDGKSESKNKDLETQISSASLIYRAVMSAIGSTRLG